MEKLNIVEDGLAGLYCLNCGFSFTCDHSARYAFIERFDIKLKCGVMETGLTSLCSVKNVG